MHAIVKSHSNVHNYKILEYLISQVRKAEQAGAVAAIIFGEF